MHTQCLLWDIPDREGLQNTLHYVMFWIIYVAIICNVSSYRYPVCDVTDEINIKSYSDNFTSDTRLSLVDSFYWLMEALLVAQKNSFTQVFTYYIGIIIIMHHYYDLTM